MCVSMRFRLRRGPHAVSKLTSDGRPEELMKRLVLDGCRHTHTRAHAPVPRSPRLRLV